MSLESSQRCDDDVMSVTTRGMAGEAPTHLQREVLAEYNNNNNNNIFCWDTKGLLILEFLDLVSLIIIIMIIIIFQTTNPNWESQMPKNPKAPAGKTSPVRKEKILERKRKQR